MREKEWTSAQSWLAGAESGRVWGSTYLKLLWALRRQSWSTAPESTWRMAAPNCSARRENAVDLSALTPARAIVRTDLSWSWESMALMSPKDSWKEPASMKGASHNWGRWASRQAWPISWQRMSGLSAEK